jgi:hypothetical protein
MYGKLPFLKLWKVVDKVYVYENDKKKLRVQSENLEPWVFSEKRK